MITVKPFRAMRPLPEYVKNCAALPYDVMSREEAYQEAKDNPYSFLHVDKAEIDLDSSVDGYDPLVYETAAENLRKLEEKGIYVSSGSACSSNKKLPVSTVLKEIHLQPELLETTLRFSFCINTTEEELDYCISVLTELLPVLRRYARH